MVTRQLQVERRRGKVCRPKTERSTTVLRHQLLKEKIAFYFDSWNLYLIGWCCYDCDRNFTMNFVFSAANLPQFYQFWPRKMYSLHYSCRRLYALFRGLWLHLTKCMTTVSVVNLFRYFVCCMWICMLCYIYCHVAQCMWAQDMLSWFCTFVCMPLHSWTAKFVIKLSSPSGSPCHSDFLTLSMSAKFSRCIKLDTSGMSKKINNFLWTLRHDTRYVGNVAGNFSRF